MNQETLQMQVAELEQKLLANDPMMPRYLSMIRASLLQHPELVHIIRPEERATMIQAMSQLAGIEISASEKKERGKKLAQQTEDDI